MGSHSLSPVLDLPSHHVERERGRGKGGMKQPMDLKWPGGLGAEECSSGYQRGPRDYGQQEASADTSMDTCQ